MSTSTSLKELRKQFFNLKTVADVGVLLNIDEQELKEIIYNSSGLYVQFEIPKKSGGTRTIFAPCKKLKAIQKTLNQYLQAVYAPIKKPSVHGFVPNQSIITNAQQHTYKRYVFNIDLEDFFLSIHPGRVRGLLMAKPYNLSQEVAQTISAICCFNNHIPQGAPTSPVISNMLCAKLDSQLRNLAKICHCTYTRYADDITFSTHLRTFPRALAEETSVGQIKVGIQLETIIVENGFKVNSKKVRLQTNKQRQVVTGIITNEAINVKRIYVSQIRAMLHAWEKYGAEAAQNTYIEKYHKAHRNPLRDFSHDYFKQVVSGKIEFLGSVRGIRDIHYIQFKNKLHNLDPEHYEEVQLPDQTIGTNNRFAILVGINKYDDNNYFKLPCCATDAELVRLGLISGGFAERNINVLSDHTKKTLPTRNRILNELTLASERAEKEDLLLFYYSGHGAFLEGVSYLIARDTFQTSLNNGGIPISQIREIMENSKAKAKVIILDACHSGASIPVKAAEIMSEDFYRSLFQQGEGVVILASCKQGQTSYLRKSPKVQSAFTYFLVEALNGAARRDNRKVITVNDLNEYVTPKVKEWALENNCSQDPTLNSATYGDIVVCKYP